MKSLDLKYFTSKNGMLFGKELIKYLMVGVTSADKESKEFKKEMKEGKEDEKITRYFLFDTVDDLEYFIENKYKKYSI